MKILLASLLAFVSSSSFVVQATQRNLTNIDTHLYTKCIFNDDNPEKDFVVCTLKKGGTQHFADPYVQCGWDEPGLGQSLGTLPQAWGKGCTIWQEENPWRRESK